MKKILCNGTTLGSIIIGTLGSILCIVAEAVAAAGVNSNTK